MFVGAFVMALVITIFVFQPYKVEGHSMDPTLHDQQRIYASRVSHTLSKMPSYGDIVIIDSRFSRPRTLKDDFIENPLISLLSKNSGNNSIYYIKRVIGKPGDVIEVKKGKVYRNGQVLDEPYINGAMEVSPYKKWTVPENHVFVMGDNRNHSTDSRVIGFCPLDHVLGIMLF